MAKFELLRNVNVGAATIKAAINVLKDSSSVRIIKTAKDIIGGEREVPGSVGDAVNILANSLFGQASDPYYYTSRFDTPVRNYLLINGGTYKALNRDGEVVDKAYPTLFIDSAIINVGMKKNIELSAVNGRNGTRKEYISDGDFTIDIDGVLSTDWGTQYPHEDMNSLREILSSPEELTVISPQLSRLGITNIVVDAFNFPQQAGFYNTQEFSIRALSHEPGDLFIESKKTVENQQDSISKTTQDVIEDEIELRTELQKALDKFFGEDSDIPLGTPINNE